MRLACSPSGRQSSQRAISRMGDADPTDLGLTIPSISDINSGTATFTDYLTDPGNSDLTTLTDLAPLSSQTFSLPNVDFGNLANDPALTAAGSNDFWNEVRSLGLPLIDAAGKIIPAFAQAQQASALTAALQHPASGTTTVPTPSTVMALLTPFLPWLLIGGGAILVINLLSGSGESAPRKRSR